MRRFRLPWYLSPWRHVQLLVRQRDEARRMAESQSVRLRRTEDAASQLLAEFGSVCLELERRDRQRVTNRNNRLARTAAGRELIQSTAASIDALDYPRRKHRG